VSLNYNEWCWEKTEVGVVVDESGSSAVQITQTGYAMQYDTSHSTLLVSRKSRRVHNVSVLIFIYIFISMRIIAGMIIVYHKNFNVVVVVL